MKTPIKIQQQNFSRDAEILRSQFEELKGNKKTRQEPKRNSLLTPLLLAIPVIVMLIILISRSISDVSNTAAEPIHQETVQTSKAVALP